MIRFASSPPVQDSASGECLLQLGEPIDDDLLNEIAARGDEVSAERFEHTRFDSPRCTARGAINRKSTSLGRAQ